MQIMLLGVSRKYCPLGYLDDLPADLCRLCILHRLYFLTSMDRRLLLLITSLASMQDRTGLENIQRPITRCLPQGDAQAIRHT